MSKNSDNDLLKELDQAKVNRFHGKAIFVAGMGFFSDAYDLFVISTAAPIIESSVVFGGQIAGNTFISGMIGAAALFGAFLGAMIFGRIADKKGRKFTYGVEMSILVVFAIISAFSINVTMLIISRFILGIGIGGDYPISATIMSEYSNVKSRGKLVLSVFAMQGFGLLAGAIVGLVSTAFLPVTESWRFMLAFGAIPAASVIYLRRKILETPRYSLESGNKTLASEAVTDATKHSTGKAVDTNGAPNFSRRINRALANKYWLFLLGTAGSWFIFDMAFYGTSVNSGTVLGLIGYGAVKGNLAETVFHIAEGNTILALAFEVPGYWIAVGLIDKAGRKLLQWAGFSVMAIIYFIFALRFTTIETDLSLFIAMYGLSFLVGNIGPNSTTFIIPTELFPTSIRTTSHGISAGSGKLGAGIFTFLVPTIIATSGFPVLFDLLAGIALAGVILTLLAIRETKNMSLEQASSLNIEQGASRHPL